MIKVKSHSLGVDHIDCDGNRERIVHIKYFKKKGIGFRIYVLTQKILEDYIDIEVID